MKRRGFLLLASPFALVVAIFLGLWSGIYNVAASAGHWPITAWLLHFAMQNSVETYSAGIQPPPLDDLALIERGATHFENGCAPCHGAPGRKTSVIPRQLLPPPPAIDSAGELWSAAELFWIIRNGLKYTAMPPWPAQTRDDEVWAVTAFVKQLPETTPERYAALAGLSGPSPDSSRAEVFVPSVRSPAALPACLRCHETDGRGRPSGAFPRLDIQTPDYLLRALEEYASGVRPSGIMETVVATLRHDELRELAHHYAAADPAGEDPSRAAPGNPLGRRIATDGVPSRKIAACATCHGLESGPVNPLFPSLNGQYAEFIQVQLRLWKERKRGGGPFADVMATVAKGMTEEEMHAVARFYAGLRAAN